MQWNLVIAFLVGVVLAMYVAFGGHLPGFH